MADQKFGFRDLRTAAELAMGPGVPATIKIKQLSITALLPIPQTGKIGAVVGKIQSAADLAGSAYSAYKETVETIKELKAMAADIKKTLKDLEAQSKKLLKGDLPIQDIMQQNSVMVQRGLATGEFFKAEDLVQMSGFTPGPLSPSELRAAKARLDQRRKDLQDMYVRISKRVMDLIKGTGGGSHIKEDYKNRTTQPPEGPSIPFAAQSKEALESTQTYKDKASSLAKGVKTAYAKASFWKRLAIIAEGALTAASVIKQFKSNPSYNTTLNTVFKDPLSGGSNDGNEPNSPTNVVYPYCDHREDRSGNYFRMNATPGAETVELYHRSGSRVEFRPDGGVSFKTVGADKWITAAGGDVWIHSSKTDKNSDKGTIHISGDTNVRIYSAGEVHIQSETDINVLAEKGDLNLSADNINIKAKRNLTLDGAKMDLRYMVFPPDPTKLVVGFTGIGPGLDMGGLAGDFPGAAGALKEKMSAFGAASKAATSAASAAGKNTGISPTNLVKPVTDAVNSVGKIATMFAAAAGIATAVGAGLMAFKQLTAKDQALLPKETPLMNPLVYNQTTPEAANYRGLMFDTPTEVHHVEAYQSHIELRKTLGDLPKTFTNRLPGKRTTLTTTIVAPDNLPDVDYLDRDAFTNSFTANTKLSASFTVAQLADSLAAPTVANFITNDEETPDPTPQPAPRPDPYPPNDPRRSPEL